MQGAGLALGRSFTIRISSSSGPQAASRKLSAVIIVSTSPAILTHPALIVPRSYRSQLSAPRSSVSFPPCRRSRSKAWQTP